MKYVYLLLTLFALSLGFSQNTELTSDAKVSVLTFGPGSALNDAFGHNAFRITDKNLGIDLVYGYGEYDFDAPYFYLKFARGKLNYLISKHRFTDIFRHYTRYNRSIKEQVLNFNNQQKQQLYAFLETNYRPENRRYLYDFFYDNCATKIRDVAEQVAERSISYKAPSGFSPKTFRHLIYEHVDRNSWGSLGIDIALGSVIDQEASLREHLFLPKYIHAFFAEAKLSEGTNLVKSSATLYEKKTSSTSQRFLLSPLVILSLVAGFILYRTYRDHQTQSRSRWLDMLISGFTGLVGLVLFLLWFATDHTATAFNYNLLWAFPFNLILIGQMRKAKMGKWVKGYLKFLLIMLSLLTLHWIIGVQVFAVALIPLLLAVTLRYVFVIRNL